jgi:hypothetical protein
MGYSINNGMVRVELFKPSGNWACEGAIDMGEYYDEGLTTEAVKKALDDGIEGFCGNWREYIVVCLDPYHQYHYPVMLMNSE